MTKVVMLEVVMTEVTMARVALIEVKNCRVYINSVAGSDVNKVTESDVNTCRKWHQRLRYHQRQLRHSNLCYWRPDEEQLKTSYGCNICTVRVDQAKRWK